MPHHATPCRIMPDAMMLMPRHGALKSIPTRKERGRMRICQPRFAAACPCRCCRQHHSHEVRAHMSEHIEHMSERAHENRHACQLFCDSLVAVLTFLPPFCITATFCGAFRSPCASWQVSSPSGMHAAARKHIAAVAPLMPTAHARMRPHERLSWCRNPCPLACVLLQVMTVYFPPPHGAQAAARRAHRVQLPACGALW